MKRRLRFRLEAAQDIEGAYLWYRRQRPGLEEEFNLCLEASLDAIQENPQQFPLLYREVRRALVRRFPYAIFFLESEAAIVVLAVLHGKRGPNILMKRLGSSR